jgi:hypothetical protein
MANFSHRCAESGALTRLRFITLTVHQQLPLDIWTNNVLDLLRLAPLENFQIYSTDAFFESPSTNHFWSQLVTMHGHHLKRFSVHRMLISLDAIDDICRRCTSLEQFFLVLEPGSLVNYFKGCYTWPSWHIFPEISRCMPRPIPNLAFGPYKLPTRSPDGCSSCSLRERCIVHYPTM